MEEDPEEGSMRYQCVGTLLVAPPGQGGEASSRGIVTLNVTFHFRLL